MAQGRAEQGYEARVRRARKRARPPPAGQLDDVRTQRSASRDAPAGPPRPGR